MDGAKETEGEGVDVDDDDEGEEGGGDVDVLLILVVVVVVVVDVAVESGWDIDGSGIRRGEEGEGIGGASFLDGNSWTR